MEGSHQRILRRAVDLEERDNGCGGAHTKYQEARLAQLEAAVVTALLLAPECTLEVLEVVVELHRPPQPLELVGMVENMVPQAEAVAPHLMGTILERAGTVPTAFSW